MFDKKKIKKSLKVLLLIAVIIVAIILLQRTLARYETTTSSEKDVDVAFWVVDNDFKQGTILITDVYPSNDTFDYTFSVSNFKVEDDGSVTKRAETDLEYDIVLKTTTNIPLEYQIAKNGANISTTQEIFTDTDGTYYRKISLAAAQMAQNVDTTDRFTIKVTFPKENDTNAEYSDLIEYIKLELNAKQIIE